MKIISRGDWGARPPRSKTTTTWQRRTGFCVHHSGASPDQTPFQIQGHSMNTKGFADVDYNFLVDRNGKIYEGRGWLVIGAHAKGNNTAYIGVCLIGDYRQAAPSDPAKRAIRWIFEEACRLAGRKLTVRGHGQLPSASTACPGTKLQAWVDAGMRGPESTARRTYTVVKGDTLSAIAHRHGVTVDGIVKLNPDIKDRDVIFPGQVLTLPR